MRQLFSAIPRLLVGLVGCFWVLGGLLGVAYAVTDHAWSVVLGAAVTVLIGWCVAYWAFIRAPWERESSNGERAT